MRFHHIGITTRDIDKSIEFYKVLGFKESKCWGEGVKRVVMLESDEGSIVELFADGTELLPQGVFRHLALKVDNTRELFEKIKAFGAEIISEPRDMDLPSNPPVPVTLAFLKGPDGEIIELFQER